jgi:hypothetical protein
MKSKSLLSIHELQLLAENGCAEGQWRLGEMYSKGQEVEKDLAKAIQDGAGKTRTTLEEGVAVQIAVNQEASNAAERASERIKKNTKELADAEDRFVKSMFEEDIDSESN